VPLLATAVVVGGLGAELVRRFRHARAPDVWPAVEVVALRVAGRWRCGPPRLELFTALYLAVQRKSAR
jgi:hypothetical protein